MHAQPHTRRTYLASQGGIFPAGGAGGCARHSTKVQMATTTIAIDRPARCLLIDQRIDLLREIEIEFRHAALAVGREDEAYFVEVNFDVRMMLQFFCELGDAVYKIDCLCEVIELESALDCLSLVFPLREIFEG